MVSLESLIAMPINDSAQREDKSINTGLILFRALINDQASDLSKDAWEEVMELRADCDGALAIIPCLTHIRATTPKAAWEPWAKHLHKREQPRPVLEPVMHFQPWP